MTATLLAYTPAAAPFLERLAWRTDLTVSLNGAESASRRLRAYPQAEYELTLEEFQAYNAGLLDAQRSQPSHYLLPLWPFAVALPAYPVQGVSAGVGVGGQVWAFAQSDGTYVTQVQGPAPFSLPPGGPFVSVVPTVPCVVDKTTSVRHPVLGLRQVQLRLRALGFREFPIPYTGPTDSNLPVLPTNWLEFTDVTDESFDRTETDQQIGAQRLIDLQYTERTLSAVVTLTEPADQLAFRSFLFAIAGRYGRFRMAHPMDGVTRTYRLTKDAVELAWMPGGYLVSKLTCKQLPQS